MIDGTITENTWTPEAVRNTVIMAQKDPSVRAFHELWYRTPTTWGMTRYRGVPTLKCPMDMQVYHELIMSLQPGLIIETGTAYGGSALHFADCLEMCGSGGTVLSIDNSDQVPSVTHQRIVFHRGSSVSVEALMLADELAEAADGPVLVSLDSDHSRAHVAAELAAYSQYVTPGSFLVVEDTNIGGHPINIGVEDGGPLAAVDAFLALSPDFVREPAAERYLLTMHPGGWLRKLES